MTETLMNPLRNDLGYIGYGALGGYIFGLGHDMYYAGSFQSATMFGRSNLEAAIMGGVANYLVDVTGYADTMAMGKAIAVGAVGSFIWHQLLRDRFVQWGWIGAI